MPLKGQKKHAVPFVYLPHGQSPEEVLKDSGLRLLHREVAGNSAALPFWPFSAGITAVTALCSSCWGPGRTNKGACIGQCPPSGNTDVQIAQLVYGCLQTVHP